jgi:ATP-dependent DNA helicase RecG
MIANRTNPPLSVRATTLLEADTPVARIEVPRSMRPVATSDGLLQRRRLQADGTPQCQPFYPHEFAGRQSDLGLLDYSALPVIGASEADFDPLERERLRQLIERFGGDRTLLTLADEALDGALGFMRHEAGVRTPTVTGLLVLGREGAIRQHLPTHEVAFQVLDGTTVRANDFYRGSLLRIFERVYEQFLARVTEEEVQFGLFRVPVPSYDQRAFREALVNALVHRDYTRLGAIHVRWEQGGIVVSNPGGFVEGVTLDNLLVTEPRPRNPSLADAIKRIGLAERTGRGVDLIYQGLLRYGRPAPDYSRSDRHLVLVNLSGGEADFGLLRIILAEEQRSQRTLPLDALIALTALRDQRRINAQSLARAIQRDEITARRVLERLVEDGLAEAHSAGAGRIYTLSSAIYRQLGQRAEYVRQEAFTEIQRVQMIQRYVEVYGKITRREVMELCRIGADQAKRLLDTLTRQQILRRIGTKRSTHYVLSEQSS